MKRLLALLLIVLLALLQVKFWVGDGGWYQAHQIERAVELQQRDNAKLMQRNDALSAEVEDLKSGEAAVEERARAELGMIKPGEVFYRVVEPAAGAAVAPPAPGDAPARPTGEAQR